jgi:hypothetical protein
LAATERARGCHEAAEIDLYYVLYDTGNMALLMMSNVEARAEAYRDYAAQIRSVATRCELPAEKAELESLAQRLENFAPVSPILSAKSRA